jgi:hypothetical protein
VSEIALGLAVRARRRGMVLLDADELAPSLAPRLGLPPGPGLRDAVDAVEYGDGDVRRTLLRVGGSLQVLAGFPSAAAAATVTASEVLHVVDALGRSGCTTVVDVARAGTVVAPALVERAGVLVVVAGATPVAVTRLLAWFAVVAPVVRGRPVHVVFNRAPRDRFRRAELHQELARTYAPSAVWFVPSCRRVDDAMWRGATVGRGSFTDAVTRVARGIEADAPVVAEPPRARRARSKWAA